MRSLPVLLLLALLLAACEMPVTGPPAVAPPSDGSIATASVITVVPAVTSAPGLISTTTAPPPSPSASSTPLPTLASASLTPSELKYRVLSRFPNFFYCDPDYYPIAREDEPQVALDRFPELQDNQEEFHAILEQLGLVGVASFTDAQKLVIYREHKKLAALHFDLIGGQYHFQLTTGGGEKASQNVQGVIDGAGRITIQQTTPGFATCPICLAAHTLIDTPHGSVPVEQVRPGDIVWTLSGSGQRVAQPVLKVARVPVSEGHVLVHLKLADGRELWASPGHPTADGRVLAALHAGEMLDGARIVLAERISYDGSATYDVLPAGSTGFYWADGILMGSTLHP
jgi:hypothetical protein